MTLWDSSAGAAAIEWAGSPASEHFVAFDERLKRAAEREGFSTDT